MKTGGLAATTSNHELNIDKIGTERSNHELNSDKISSEQSTKLVGYSSKNLNSKKTKIGKLE
jgi:hypothetical protein